jgi:hypothetical protein
VDHTSPPDYKGLNYPIIFDVVAQTCLDQRQHNLTLAQMEWFIHHVVIRTRWLYANNTKWKRSLELESNQGRDQFYVWVNHLLDPSQYRKRYSIEISKVK